MDNLLSPMKAAEILDCKRGHVYKLIRDGELASVKFGPRMVRIETKELERYRASKCNRHGALECTVESSPPSRDRDPAAAALSLMRLTGKAQRVLSASSTLKRPG